MARGACALALCLTAILAGSKAREINRLDLLRILAEKPWLTSDNRWERGPRVAMELGNPGPHLDIAAPSDPDNTDEEYQNMMNEEIREGSEKRSALATALNSGRRRRQPTPALGKAVSPYVGVGVLNDVGSFFDSLRDNLETLASLSPQQRANIFSDPPSVVNAPAHVGTVSGGGGTVGSGGGVGFRKLHALRPLRPTGNIRSYNRRSFVEADGAYPGANNHDPGLLWTGLGR